MYNPFFRKKRENLNLSSDMQKILFKSDTSSNTPSATKKKKGKTQSTTNKENMIHPPCPLYPKNNVGLKKLKNKENSYDASNKDDSTSLFDKKKVENCNESDITNVMNISNIEEMFPKYLNDIENSISILKKCYLSFCKKKETKKTSTSLQNFTQFLNDNATQNHIYLQDLSKLLTKSQCGVNNKEEKMNMKFDVDTLKKLYFENFGKETNDIQELYDFYKTNFTKEKNSFSGKIESNGNNLKSYREGSNRKIKKFENAHINNYNDYFLMNSPSKKDHLLSCKNISPISNKKQSQSYSSQNVRTENPSQKEVEQKISFNNDDDKSSINQNPNKSKSIELHDSSYFPKEKLKLEDIIRENFFVNKMRSSTSVDKLNGNQLKNVNFSMPLEAKKNLISKIKSNKLRLSLKKNDLENKTEHSEQTHPENNLPKTTRLSFDQMKRDNKIAEVHFNSGKQENKLKKMEVDVSELKIVQQPILNKNTQSSLERKSFGEIKQQLDIKNKKIYQYLKNKVESDENFRQISVKINNSKNNITLGQNKVAPNKSYATEKEKNFIAQIENLLDDSNLYANKERKNSKNDIVNVSKLFNNEKINEMSFYEGLNKEGNMGCNKELDLSNISLDI